MDGLRRYQSLESGRRFRLDDHLLYFKLQDESTILKIGIDHNSSLKFLRFVGHAASAFFPFWTVGIWYVYGVDYDYLPATPRGWLRENQGKIEEDFRAAILKCEEFGSYRGIVTDTLPIQARVESALHTLCLDILDDQPLTPLESYENIFPSDCLESNSILLDYYRALHGLGQVNPEKAKDMLRKRRQRTHEWLRGSDLNY